MLGGLPGRGRAAALRARPRGSREEFIALLRRKRFWLEDVEQHPICLGVPLGRAPGTDNAVLVDVGLKNFATVSIRELAACSPQVNEALIDHALQPGPPGPSKDLRVLEHATPIPMAVVEKEDVKSLPIATPVRASPAASHPTPPHLPRAHSRRAFADAPE